MLVTNGRLKDEGELGHSFEGKTVSYDAKKNALVEAKKADRFFLDELVRKLAKKDLEEWLAIEQREVEAEKAAEAEPEAKPAKKAKAGKTKATKKTEGKLSGLDAAVKVLTEAGGAMKCGDMVEQMISKGYPFHRRAW